MKFYTLNEQREPVPCDSQSWVTDRQGRGIRDVGKTMIRRGFLWRHRVLVSTVFLGFDHSLGAGGPPLLFETMIFGLPGDDEYQERCSTWQEAEAQHAKAVTFARGQPMGWWER